MTSHEAATKKTFEHLDIIVNGAAPCSASDIQQFLAKAEVNITSDTLRPDTVGD